MRYVLLGMLGAAIAIATEESDGAWLRDLSRGVPRLSFGSVARVAEGSDRSWRPDYLNGVALQFVGSGVTRVGATVARWEAWEQDSALVSSPPPGELERLLVETHEVAVRVADALEVSATDCGRPDQLRVVHLKPSTMNDEARFGGWRTVNGGYISVLHGLYDPTPEAPRDAVLAYTEPDAPRARVLVHELGHFWYSRFCVSGSASVTTERFARAVEREWLLPVLDL